MPYKDKEVRKAKDRERNKRRWADPDYRRRRTLTITRWREANLEKCNAALRRYSEAHPERRRDSARRWREANKDKQRAANKRWVSMNRERHNARQRAYFAKRRRDGSSFKLLANLRRRVGAALKGRNKSAHTLELIGCSPAQFMRYIESLWKPGMSWANYGKHDGCWHVDHVIPCALFDLSLASEQRACFGWNNTQPLWALDNLSKNDGVDWARFLSPVRAALGQIYVQ